MGVDDNWPTYCEVPFCNIPADRPHHHHLVGPAEMVNPYGCTCGDIAEPGTRAKDV